METLPGGTEALGSAQPGSRFLSIDGETTETWRDVQQGLFDSSPGPVTLELANPSTSIEIRIPVEEIERRALVASVVPWAEAGVGGVTPGSPADDAGLEAGDRVLGVAGVPVASWFEFVEEIEAHPGELVELRITRENRELIREVTLDSEREVLADGTSAQVGKIGIFQPPRDVTYARVTMSEAVVQGYRETAVVTGLILGFLRDLVTGGISPRSVGSIVTIGEASGQAAAAGFDTFLRFMALFSVNLAILNLLPIPVLDGGHLVFLAIEAVRGGRGLTIEQRLAWSNVGFLIVVGIMVWALSNDFLRLLGL